MAGEVVAGAFGAGVPCSLLVLLVQQQRAFGAVREAKGAPASTYCIPQQMPFCSTIILLPEKSFSESTATP